MASSSSSNGPRLVDCFSCCRPPAARCLDSTPSEAATLVFSSAPSAPPLPRRSGPAVRIRSRGASRSRQHDSHDRRDTTELVYGRRAGKGTCLPSVTRPETLEAIGRTFGVPITHSRMPRRPPLLFCVPLGAWIPGWGRARPRQTRHTLLGSTRARPIHPRPHLDTHSLIRSPFPAVAHKPRPTGRSRQAAPAGGKPRVVSSPLD